MARYTAAALAQGVGVQTKTVYDYLHGRAFPSPPIAEGIVTLSCGRVSFADLYAHRRTMLDERRTVDANRGASASAKMKGNG